MGYKKASDGSILYQAKPLEGSRFNSISHNWCDKTTWYTTSERTTDEVMVDSGNHTTYNLTTPCYIVDCRHGKITHEVRIENTHGVVVKVDDEEQTENPPGTSSGDYGVDFTTGSVTFNEALTGTEVVKLSYSKVIDSTWKLIPDATKQIRTIETELQASADIQMNDGIEFEVHAKVGMYPPLDALLQRSGAFVSVADAGDGYVTVTTSAAHGLSNGYTVGIASSTYYDGQYTISNVTSTTFRIQHSFDGTDTGGWGSGVYAYGTLLGLSSLDPSKRVVYKTLRDIINDCNKAYPVVPAIDASNWRGLSQNVNVFVWNFATTTDLRSDYGMELHLYLQNHVECGGTYAVTTLYNISEDLS